MALQDVFLFEKVKPFKNICIPDAEKAIWYDTNALTSKLNFLLIKSNLFKDEEIENYKKGIFSLNFDNCSITYGLQVDYLLIFDLFYIK